MCTNEHDKIVQQVDGCFSEYDFISMRLFSYIELIFHVSNAFSRFACLKFVIEIEVPC